MLRSLLTTVRNMAVRNTDGVKTTQIDEQYPEHSIPLMPSVTILDLSGDQSPMRDDTMHACHSITALDLSDNPHITDAGLVGLSALTTLNLTRNKRITSDGLRHLTALTALDLTENDTVIDVSALAPRLRALSLSMASVRKNHITDEQVSCLTALQELDLSSNDLITDRGLVGLTQLQWLSILDQESVTGTYQPLVEQGGLARIATVEMDPGLGLDEEGRIIEISNVDLLIDGLGALIRPGGSGGGDHQDTMYTRLLTVV